MKKKVLAIVGACVLGIGLLGGCASSDQTGNSANSDSAGVEAGSPESAEAGMLVYASNDYSRINPAIDEHGEINLLLFDGLTAHDADNHITDGLADHWDIDGSQTSYTFHLKDGVHWHDGEKFTAEDVKFTIEAIMDPENESEIASNYAEVDEIIVEDPLTVTFKLSERNVAFLDYMTIGILPKHLLDGKDMQEDEFFRNPVGTGPYKMAEWVEGQSITLEKNDDYFKGAPNIPVIVFKIVEDDNAKALQLQSGEVNFAKITPKDARSLADKEGFHAYNMKTSDYRGIMYNFNNPFWQENADVIPAISYGIDRQAMVDSVILGDGIVAYSPIQRNEYYDDTIEKYDYDPAKAKEIIEAAGWTLGDDGIYEKDGQKLSFTVNVKEGDQVRADLAAIASQQLKEIGVDCRSEIRADIDWANQDAFLIGWGSPFDADDHTWKVFGTDQGSNYSAYSNAAVDEALLKARQTDDPTERVRYYTDFQQAIFDNPPYTFFCYVDVDYVSNITINGITPDTILGHHGVGIFWNVKDWTIE